MRVEKISDTSKKLYNFETSRNLLEKLQEDTCDKAYDYLNFYIKNDNDSNKLKLLVILSPIFIASFDSSNKTLDFFKNAIAKSNFTYALYEHFFPFDEEKYFDFYRGHDSSEDIILGEDGFIRFRVNPLDDDYIVVLAYLIEKLIEDDSNRQGLLRYFAKIRNDIVINGRRSILANGIQAFYLSKYVVVWMLIICERLMKKNNDAGAILMPIYDKLNKLQRPIFSKK
ncbi:MAG: hypothetical protein MR512_06650 [Anaerococcus sp.]|nr:hypothetical protein [Anaerococcus sp.]